MASAGCVPDIWQWIRSLPEQWSGGSYSLQICSSPSTNQSLNLVISRASASQHHLNLSFCICDESHDTISLWSSTHSSNNLRPANTTHDDLSSGLLRDIICGVLQYGPFSNSRSSLRRLPNVQIPDDDDDSSGGKILNVAALTLAILVCIYEAPSSLRGEFIGAIDARLMRDDMGDAAKELMLALGSNVEEQWMRSVNLGATSWAMECLRSGSIAASAAAGPAGVFSYAVSAAKLWRVQVYCPVVAMVMEQPSHQTRDERLLFSLNYHQLQSVIQFVCRVSVKKNWIDVNVNVDNIRCDLVQLVSETLMARQGYGSDEKHFPSRVSLHLTPLSQPDILSLSVSRSTDNPVHEVGVETGLDASLGVPASMGLGVSAHETVTRAVRPWRFEHSVQGSTAALSWFLHGGADGREVVSSEPRRMELCRPRSWFRNRYTSPNRPFTRSGGVIFAGDEYGGGVCWRMCPGAAGKTVEWEIKGRVWVTYWPNKRRTMHTETRRLEFREMLKLTIAE